MVPVTPTEISDDVLRKIQLRVARRADELARERQTHTSLDLDCWLIAEAEMFREATVLVPHRISSANEQGRANSMLEQLGPACVADKRVRGVR